MVEGKCQAPLGAKVGVMGGVYPFGVLERAGIWERGASIVLVPGPLAQLAEQLTLNQRVVGSSPTRSTTF